MLFMSLLPLTGFLRWLKTFKTTQKVSSQVSFLIGYFLLINGTHVEWTTWAWQISMLILRTEMHGDHHICFISIDDLLGLMQGRI
jgi:hypothetical protein